MPDRIVSIAIETFNSMGPDAVADMLKDYGFAFEQEGCPWRLRWPYRISRQPRDTITFMQWDQTLQ